MAKVIDGLRIFTYTEWIELPAVKELNGSREDCDICSGEGEHECECGHTHECQACDGSGKIDNIREIYETELRGEIERLNAWINGETIKNLSNLLYPHTKKQPLWAGPMVILNIDGKENNKRS